MIMQTLLTDKSQQILAVPKEKQQTRGDQIHISGKYNWFRRDGKRHSLDDEPYRKRQPSIPKHCNTNSKTVQSFTPICGMYAQNMNCINRLTVHQTTKSTCFVGPPLALAVGGPEVDGRRRLSLLLPSAQCLLSIVPSLSLFDFFVVVLLS
jgi:hypothetical protein